MDRVIDKDTVTRLMNVYEHVDDVDLFTGGMAEKPVVGGIVGPTFACIIGQQFLNLRKGDRFWYENGNHPGAFTPQQLQEIRKTSLARVVCDCLDDVDRLQPFAFLQPDQFANIRTSCQGSGIPRMSFEAWREKVPLRPTQFNSQSLYSSIQNLLNTTEDLQAKLGPIDFLQPPFLDEDANPESPERPQFSYNQDKSNIEEKLQFVDEEESLQDILRQPTIGLEYDVKYNDELPRQLSPDQYYNLNWAIDENRQDLKPEFNNFK